MQRLSNQRAGKPFALVVWGNDDLKLGAAMDVVDLNKLNQTNGIAMTVFRDKAPFGVVALVHVNRVSGPLFAILLNIH